jgi:hypothetical protein
MCKRDLQIRNQDILLFVQSLKRQPFATYYDPWLRRPWPWAYRILAHIWAFSWLDSKIRYSHISTLIYMYQNLRALVGYNIYQNPVSSRECPWVYYRILVYIRTCSWDTKISIWTYVPKSSRLINPLVYTKIQYTHKNAYTSLLLDFGTYISDSVLMSIYWILLHMSVLMR